MKDKSCRIDLSNIIKDHESPFEWPYVREATQKKIRIWCNENVGAEGSAWNFDNNLLYSNIPGEPFVTLHSGIYIYDAQSRVAFKLRYGL